MRFLRASGLPLPVRPILGPSPRGIPLHTNGSENDFRCQFTKRKVSGGTRRSDPGRDCRDAFLGLFKTCAKLGFTFWEYLGARLAMPNHPDVQALPQLIKRRCATA